MEKFEVDTEILIAKVQSKPVLWDKMLESYRDKILTKNAWNDVCEEFNPNFGDLEDKKKQNLEKTRCLCTHILIK